MVAKLGTENMNPTAPSMRSHTPAVTGLIDLLRRPGRSLF